MDEGGGVLGRHRRDGDGDDAGPRANEAGGEAMRGGARDGVGGVQVPQGGGRRGSPPAAPSPAARALLLCRSRRPSPAAHRSFPAARAPLLPQSDEGSQRF